jgi:hypothetical protein
MTVVDRARQVCAVDAEELQQFLRPVAGGRIPELGARGVGRVGVARLPGQQTTGDEARQRSHHQFAGGMRRLHGRQMIETPAHLAGAVVRCQHQAGARPDHAGVRAQLLQPGRVAPVLPGNHRAERRAAVAVPAAHAGALRGQTGGDDAAAGRQFFACRSDRIHAGNRSAPRDRVRCDRPRCAAFQSVPIRWRSACPDHQRPARGWHDHPGRVRDRASAQSPSCGAVLCGYSHHLAITQFGQSGWRALHTCRPCRISQ